MLMINSYNNGFMEICLKIPIIMILPPGKLKIDGKTLLLLQIILDMIYGMQIIRVILRVIRILLYFKK
jgi:hypothetical protein